MWKKFTDFLRHPIVQLVGGPVVLAVLSWIVAHLADLALWQIWLIILISVCLGLFVVNQIAIWRERTKKRISQLSNEELRAVVRSWIDKPFFKVKTNEKDGVLFSFTVETHKRNIDIERYKNEPSLIYLGGKIVVEDEKVVMMSKLPEPKKSNVVADLVMELARVGVLWAGVKHPLKEFVIEDRIMIDDELSEFYLMEHISFTERAIIIGLEYIGKIARELSAGVG